MKVLFTSFSYYPETSGVPIVIQYLAEGLVQLGHTVTVVTRKNGQNLANFEIVNDVIIYRYDIGLSLFKRNTGDVKSYIDFVINYPKDVLVLECIQCHTTDLLLPYLYEMDCKIVLHSHGGPGLMMKPFGWEGDLLHSIGHTHNWLRWKIYYGWTLPKYAKFIDATICLSLCASDLSYMNKIMNKVYILENAAHDMFFDESFYDRDISSIVNLKNKNYILCIANYIENKSQLDIIKAFSIVKDTDCSLVLIGSKPTKYYKKVIKTAVSYATKYNKEIKVLYQVDRSSFPSLLRHSKLFVMASKHEEYPVSLVESMAVGTPFLSTNAGCSRILPGGVSVTKREDLGLFMDLFEADNNMLKSFGSIGKDYSLHHNTKKTVIGNFERILLNL